MAIDNTQLNKSFGYAWKGIVWSCKHNQNLRIHLFIALLVITIAVVLKVSEYEMIALSIAILLVLSAEMINTSIEEMTNLIVSEHRKEAEIAKDVAAGMVLITAVGSVFIGLLVFVPRFLLYF